MRSHLPLVLAAAILSGSCASVALDDPDFIDPGPIPEPEAEAEPAASGAPAAVRAERPAPLIGWDGSPIGASTPIGAGRSGGPVEVQLPAHDVKPSEGGRMYILELYQAVLEERDALRIELGALDAEVERQRAALEEGQGEIERLEARVAELQAGREALLAENIELAERLLTVQIGRLEAERLLLEIRIAERRRTPPTVEVDGEAKGGTE